MAQPLTALLRLASLSLALLAGTWTNAFASTVVTEIRCPEHLVQAATPQGVPTDWILRGAPAELSLQRAAFYNGDPAGLGTLAPESTHRNGTTETSTWDFAEATGTPVWVGCLYRDGTAVVARPLPTDVHRCTTRMRVSAMGDVTDLLSVTCN